METAYLDVVFSNIFEVVNALIEQLISVALCLSGEALWIPTQWDLFNQEYEYVLCNNQENHIA